MSGDEIPKGDCEALVILQGNSIRIPLRDESVHAIVTSFPYYGLRSYGLPPTIWGGDSRCAHVWGPIVARRTENNNGLGRSTLTSGSGPERRKEWHDGKSGEVESAFCQLCGAWLGCFGLEPTIALHVQNAVAVCREIKRVLRRDGIFYLNYGDSYATGKNGRSAADTKAVGKDDRTFRDKPFSVTELPAKNLCMIPARVAIALQEDGWILRSEFPWVKGNSMPSSVTDRPGTAHEHVFMLVKSARYYFDMEAVRKPAQNRPFAGKEAKTKRPNDTSWHDNRYAPGATGYGHHPNGRALRTSDPFFDSLDTYIAHLQDVRDNGGMLVDTEGLPAALIVNTESYSSTTKDDRSLHHYVADRGRPYRVSPDCPIHSPQRKSQTSDTPGYGEQQAGLPSRNPDTDADHVQEPSSEPPANEGHDNNKYRLSRMDHSRLQTSPLQTPENTGEYKSDEGHPETTSCDETQPRTSHTLESSEWQDYKKDSEDQPCLSSATGHNTQSHKTDLVHSTSPLDTASAQMTFHTGDIPASPLLFDSAGHTSENNTLGDSSSYGPDSGPSEETIYHSEDKQNVPYSNCTCIWQNVKTDHYATFPRKLISPLIQTTPERVCPACSAPWQRVVEKEAMVIKRSDRNNHTGNRTGASGTMVSPPRAVTTGWQPTCKCPNNTPIPAVILDCFCGSGTVGAVCNELGRRFIGIDLSATYLAENALVRSEKKTSRKSLEQLPMFSKPP